MSIGLSILRNKNKRFCILSFVIAVKIHWSFVNVASILSDKRKYHFESIYVLSLKSYPHSMESKIFKFCWKHKILVCGLLWGCHLLLLLRRSESWFNVLKPLLFFMYFFDFVMNHGRVKNHSLPEHFLKIDSFLMLSLLFLSQGTDCLFPCFWLWQGWFQQGTVSWPTTEHSDSFLCVIWLGGVT